MSRVIIRYPDNCDRWILQFLPAELPSLSGLAIEILSVLRKRMGAS